MLRIALVYGAISGAVVIGFMIVGLNLSIDGDVQPNHFLGYLVMIAALSLIFVGVKRYRDRELGGVVKFGRALVMGLAIGLVASLAYIVIWEIYLAAIDYQFIDKYAAAVIERKREAGVSGEQLEATVEHMEMMKNNYGNPLFRLPITFLEIFPIALLVALVSAALLRNPRVLPARRSAAQN